LTGALASGEAKFGVVVFFSPLVLVVLGMLALLEELELDELLEDPQPAASDSAAQTASVESAPLMPEANPSLDWLVHATPIFDRRGAVRG